MRRQSPTALRAYQAAAQATRDAEWNDGLRESGVKKPPPVYLHVMDDWFPPPVGDATPPVTIRNPDGSIQEVVSAVAFRRRFRP